MTTYRPLLDVTWTNCGISFYRLRGLVCEMERLDFSFGRHKLRFSADKDAGETVMRRLKRQLSKRCIRFENILKTKTGKGETAETRIRRTNLVQPS